MEDRQRRLESAAARYERGAQDLETAAKHLHTTARHFREGDIPRGAAHAWAAWGLLQNAEDLLRALAVEHAERSSV